MPLPLTVSCSSKIQIGFTFLVLAHPGRPGQRAVKRVCVCVCVCVCSTPHGVWHIACNMIKHCNITTKTKPKTLHATNLQDFSVAVLVKTATIKTAKRLWAVLSWCKHSFTCKGLKRGRGVHLLWMVKERSVDDMLPEEHSRSWSLDWALVTFFLFFSPIDSPHRFDPP